LHNHRVLYGDHGHTHGMLHVDSVKLSFDVVNYYGSNFTGIFLTNIRNALTYSSKDFSFYLDTTLSKTIRGKME
jgi:hypothetical protein